MPTFGQGIRYVPSKNHDDRKPINKNADCLTCMSGHSLFKKEKKEKKKILKDKDLFVMKGNKKSHNIIKGKKRTNGKNIKNNKGKSSKLKKGVVKHVQNKAKEIDGSLERKRRKFNKFIGKYK
tara:strand:+ start:921 stop:1289 length:369 start_codon:yes stop_codon:yes gene_type:complete